MSANVGRQRLRDRIAACVGAEAYNRLIESVPDTRKKGRLRFWQEQLFKRVSDEAEVPISSLAEFLDLLADAPPLIIALPPPTREQFLADPNRLWYSARRGEIEPAWFTEAWHTLPAFRDNLTYELTRSVSKNGDFFIASDLLAYLPTVLKPEEVVAIYVAIRDESGRPEDEWRVEFERAFAEHAKALPPRLGGLTFGVDELH